MFRAIGIVILIAVLAAIVATAVLVLTDAGQHTSLGESIKSNIDDQIQAIKDLIQNNTKCESYNSRHVLRSRLN